jgi:hypothetical protein
MIIATKVQNNTFINNMIIILNFKRDDEYSSPRYGSDSDTKINALLKGINIPNRGTKPGIRYQGSYLQ